MFISLKDGTMLEKNYTMLTSVLSPISASEEDAAIIEKNAISANVGIVLGIILPIIFMFILKSKID